MNKESNEILSQNVEIVKTLSSKPRLRDIITSIYLPKT